MIDPVTQMLIATAISTAAKAGGDYLSGQGEARQSKRRAKEMRRETQGGFLQDQLNRGADLEAHRLNSRKRMGQRGAQNMQNTADLVREAFNI